MSKTMNVNKLTADDMDNFVQGSIVFHTPTVDIFNKLQDKLRAQFRRLPQRCFYEHTSKTVCGCTHCSELDYASLDFYGNGNSYPIIITLTNSDYKTVRDVMTRIRIIENESIEIAIIADKYKNDAQLKDLKDSLDEELEQLYNFKVEQQ